MASGEQGQKKCIGTPLHVMVILDGRNRNDFNAIESLNWESKGSIYFLSKYKMLKCLDGQICDSIAL